MACAHLVVQVVQFLLARNYHLTALELLVEAGQTGHADEVRASGGLGMRCLGRHMLYGMACTNMKEFCIAPSHALELVTLTPDRRDQLHVRL